MADSKFLMPAAPIPTS